MKSSHLASLLFAVVLGAGGSILLTHTDPVHAQNATTSADTVTVFVDATFGFRKKHMANQLTKSHAEFAARGYRYVNMSPYNENGDLTGFFVTYTKP